MRCSVRLIAVVAAFAAPTLLISACTERPVDRDTGVQRSTAHVSLPVETGVFLASAAAGLPPGGVTAADLPDADSPGAKALGQYCTLCHALPAPAMHSATDWPIVLRRMWVRMDKVAKDFDIPSPSTAERAVLLPYLVEHALKVEKATLPAGTGRDAFAATCSRCHALPDPRQHSAPDWVAVARRMRQHSEDMLGQTIDQQRFAQIVLYLEGVSKQTAM